MAEYNRFEGIQSRFIGGKITTFFGRIKFNVKLLVADAFCMCVFSKRNLIRLNYLHDKVFYKFK